MDCANSGDISLFFKDHAKLVICPPDSNKFNTRAPGHSLTLFLSEKKGKKFLNPWTDRLCKIAVGSSVPFKEQCLIAGSAPLQKQ